MNKIYIFIFTIALLAFSVAVAQTSAAPEIPKNYKPAPKALLPMPVELTENDVFPILGITKLLTKKANRAIYPSVMMLKIKGLFGSGAG